MEHHGTQPDLLVEQRPDDEVTDRDVQMQRAVDEIMERLGDPEQARRPTPPQGVSL
ncbi:hypothetical protein [Aquisalimonas sp.]|uniref:hypothetical protein n=1 Tax=Aquisalimonas sp. TaxID=1872621 RepID=UPI0025BFE349|nr:hypothetical protein [Aquisalimonas sp.]